MSDAIALDNLMSSDIKSKMKKSIDFSERKREYLKQISAINMTFYEREEETLTNNVNWNFNEH